MWGGGGALLVAQRIRVERLGVKQCAAHRQTLAHYNAVAIINQRKLSIAEVFDANKIIKAGGEWGGVRGVEQVASAEGKSGEMCSAMFSIVTGRQLLYKVDVERRKWIGSEAGEKHTAAALSRR